MIYALPNPLPAVGLRAPPPPRYRPAAKEVARLVGGRLRRARRLAGLSRQALAHAIGVEAETVRRYESGRRMPPARLAAAALFLGVPLSWFFRDEADDE